MTDPEKSELDMVVLDPNILELTRVLYYYDRRLSLRKGRYDFASIYPAPEFVALRLLLLQKIHRGERIPLEKLIRPPHLLLDKTWKPSREELERVHLRAEELQLLRDIIEAEPHIYAYLQSPSLVRALLKVGAVEPDDMVLAKVREAKYKSCFCRPLEGGERTGAVKISILPSMIREYHYGETASGLSAQGFRPTQFLGDMISRLEAEILEATRAQAGEAPDAKARHENPEDGWWQRAREQVVFYAVDQKPLVIYPENADAVIREVCPDADFTVILLDKNIYLSLHLEEEDQYPQVNRIYLDIMDVKYAQAKEEIDQIGAFVYARVKRSLRKPFLMRKLRLPGLPGPGRPSGQPRKNEIR
jgi:hypothetical protein